MGTPLHSCVPRTRSFFFNYFFFVINRLTALMRSYSSFRSNLTISEYLPYLAFLLICWICCNLWRLLWFLLLTSLFTTKVSYAGRLMQFTTTPIRLFFFLQLSPTSFFHHLLSSIIFKIRSSVTLSIHLLQTLSCNTTSQMLLISIQIIYNIRFPYSSSFTSVWCSTNIISSLLTQYLITIKSQAVLACASLLLISCLHRPSFVSVLLMWSISFTSCTLLLPNHCIFKQNTFHL